MDGLNGICLLQRPTTLALGAMRSLACACPASTCPVRAARKVVPTAELTRLTGNPPVPQNRFQLLCKIDGGPLLKKEVVQFYKDLMAAAGLDQLRRTGHSARVTGAMRMAYAGHPVWTIQVFGRWGSPAILEYVRDAILGQQGGHIAQVTERSLTSKSIDVDMISEYASTAADRRGDLHRPKSVFLQNCGRCGA